MRKLFPSIGLWLLLLAGQYGAVLHELSHVCAAADATVGVHFDARLEKSCELCLGYSQLASPAAPGVPDFIFEHTTAQVATARPAIDHPAELPTPRSRGPPLSDRNS